MRNKQFIPLFLLAALGLSSTYASAIDNDYLKELGIGIMKGLFGGKKSSPSSPTPSPSPSVRPTAPQQSGGVPAGSSQSAMEKYSIASEPFRGLAMNAPDGIVPIKVSLLDGVLDINRLGAGNLSPSTASNEARFFDLLALGLEPGLFEQYPYHYAQAHLKTPDKRQFLELHPAVSDNADLQASIRTSPARWKDSEFQPGMSQQSFLSSGYKEKLLAYAPRPPFRMVATFNVRLGEYANGGFPIVFPSDKPVAAANSDYRSLLSGMMGGQPIRGYRMEEPGKPPADAREQHQQEQARLRKMAEQRPFTLSFSKLALSWPTTLPMDMSQAREFVSSMNWTDKSARNVLLAVEVSVDRVKGNASNPNEKLLSTHLSRMALYGNPQSLWAEPSRNQLLHVFVGEGRQEDPMPKPAGSTWGQNTQFGAMAETAASSMGAPTKHIASDNWCEGLKALIATADEAEPFGSIKVASSCQAGSSGYQKCVAATEQLLPMLGAYAVANNQRCTLSSSLLNREDPTSFTSVIHCQLALEGEVSAIEQRKLPQAQRLESEKRAADALKRLYADFKSCVPATQDGGNFRMGRKTLNFIEQTQWSPELSMVLKVNHGPNVTPDGRYCDPRMGGREADRCRRALR